MKALLTLFALLLLPIGSKAHDKQQQRLDLVEEFRKCREGGGVVSKAWTIRLQPFNGLRGRYPIPVDTTPFYAKVDTVLTKCERDHRILSAVIAPRGRVTVQQGAMRFVGEADTPGRVEVWEACNHKLSPAIDTTWLPKVQVWMDSVELKAHKYFKAHRGLPLDTFELWIRRQ